MAIYRLLKDTAFEPQDIPRMGVAYERALVMLRLKDRNDPLTEIIAKLIIEVAEGGESDPEKICAQALRRLNKTACRAE
jgi:hypothetical protein